MACEGDLSVLNYRYEKYIRIYTDRTDVHAGRDLDTRDRRIANDERVLREQPHDQ